MAATAFYHSGKKGVGRPRKFNDWTVTAIKGSLDGTDVIISARSVQRWTSASAESVEERIPPLHVSR